ncbi:NucA/NucB deoxyribonuclease domain-containing protein [Actinosynnema sp. NPDC051121]
MGITEPGSPLWTAVKAIDDTWPPDDEVVAIDLGRAWERGADTMVRGARTTGSAGADAVASWQDAAGGMFGQRVDGFTRAVSRLDLSMRDLAARAEHYGREVESTKTAITRTIVANERTYVLLGNPLLGALGLALRNAFAGVVAGGLRSMVDAKAAALRANPTGAQAQQPQPVERNPVAGFIADLLRDVGDGDVTRARAIGEFLDDVIDNVGAGVGDLLRSVGATAAGDAVERTADGVGDDVAENWLESGATSRNIGYDVARDIDGTDRPRTVYISRERYPQAAEHIDDAQNGTIWTGFESRSGQEPKPSVLTVQREGADARRDAATSVVPSRSDYDRDEYPPAVAKEGGGGSSVRYIDPSDNRGAGASQGNQLSGKTKSIQRQLDGTGLTVVGDGKAAEGDLFRVETFG